LKACGVVSLPKVDIGIRLLSKNLLVVLTCCLLSAEQHISNFIEHSKGNSHSPAYYLHHFLTQ
jgi:hypothetical protein